MKKFLTRPDIVPLLIIIYAFILFLPGFFLYFHQDDFIHFSVSQNLSQVVNAFDIFAKGQFHFYRPIPTQGYFFFGRLFFGLNPLSFHIINFIIFSINIFLVFFLVKSLAKSKNTARIAVLIYGINSTHVAPLFAAAYVHELLYVFFALLCLLTYIRSHGIKNKPFIFYFLSVIFFILALMTKENAVILPGILLIYEIFIIRASINQIIKKLFPFAFILLIYLLGHFFFYGLAQSPSYQVIIGKPTINIFLWYVLWALSVPNILIDFIGPKLYLNPVFFKVAGPHAYISLLSIPLLIILISLLLFIFILNNRKNDKFRLLMFGVCWFIIGLIPLLPFPLHKLGTEQAFSLVGLSTVIGLIIINALKSHAGKIISSIFIIIYIINATNSIILARSTHWIERSADQAQSVISYMQKTYPKLPDNAVIYFENGQISIPQYGSSRQLYQSTGGGFGLNLMLQKPDLFVYFQDIDNPPKTNENKLLIKIDSSKFLGY